MNKYILFNIDIKKILFSLIILFMIIVSYLFFNFFDRKSYSINQVYKQARAMNINWDIKVEFTSISVPKETLLGSVAGHEFAAMVTPSTEYYSAVITFNLPIVKDLSRKQIKELVQHELTHIYITEMREYIFKELKPTEDQKVWLIYHEERLVTNITNAF